jgi:hypothetical protein
MVDRDAQSRLEEAIRKHVYGGNVVAFKKRDPAQPRAATSSQAARVSITGTGNAAVLGSHNSVTINVRSARKKVVADVKPGEDHITDSEAARLQELVHDLHERTAQPYQRIWVALLRSVHAPTYRLIALEDFPQAESYLLKWLASAAPVDEDEAHARSRHIRYIKVNQRKMGKPDEDITAFLADRFGKDGLHQCSVDELVVVRNELVKRWRHTF